MNYIGLLIVSLLFIVIVLFTPASSNKEGFEATSIDGVTIENDTYMVKKKVSVDNINLNGRVYFRDPSLSTTPNGPNGSDPYYMEKINDGNNNSSLRITINDDWNESLQVWGNSCASAGGCGGPGRMKHHLGANGDVIHTGNLILNDQPNSNSWILHAPHDGRRTLYIAPGGGAGGMSWDWGNQIRMEPDSSIYAKKLCLGNTCLTEADLKMMVKHGDRITIRGTEGGNVTNRLLGWNSGRGHAQFANTNRGGWEQQIVEKCGLPGIGDGQRCWGIPDI